MLRRTSSIVCECTESLYSYFHNTPKITSQQRLVHQCFLNNRADKRVSIYTSESIVPINKRKDVIKTKKFIHAEIINIFLYKKRFV